MASLLLLSLLCAGLLIPSTPAIAQGEVPSFSDVPPDHPTYPAVEYLKSTGVLQGYADGTFRPDAKVNRAEATKVIVAPRATTDALAKFTQTVFDDVPSDAWYLPYVEMARQVFGFIDGPPKKISFNGERPVIKAEFLKMVLIANSIDITAFSEIRLPLSSDVTNPDEWFYPYVRYSISASMTAVTEEGLLSPGRELTRGDVALLLYRFLMYQENRRTQALLSESEGEILRILDALGNNDIAEAEYASARALVAARGAHASRPDTPLVQSALKITEAFRTLVRAYRAGLNLEFDMVITLTGQAWDLAEQGRIISPEMQSIAERVQQSAHTMADSARELKGQQ